MKKTFIAIIGTGLILGSAGIFAVSATDVTTNWICTTNASSSEVAADQAADEKMKTNKTSASEAFSFAQQNCRDCTSITCEVQS
ncbi:hypothetical protein TUM19329_10410 [Legionella antarctica]|uniref:DUF4189 domain-containing protein n=1 Tax=Legionella antarctica TaxID=2708020 RepID=A0A6F8T3E5_9GAMM|nr:hypothetical protein [Legionella antarctica]BCA94680.1 hypothetical protein TUM19329_10410 [Legionella antarctica]